MRHILAMAVLVLLTSAASAQPYTIQMMMQTGVQQCVSQRGPQAYPYCNCWVQRWVGLWSQYDISVWTRTGQATPHMRQMEAVAAQQCGGQ